MTAGQRMELLYQSLRRTAGDADVSLLTAGQILVSRNLVRDPAFEQGGKSATSMPGPDGYQVYVGCLPVEEELRQAEFSQRVTRRSSPPIAWDGRTMRLRLAPGATGAEWVVGDGRGGVVTVHVAAGSDQVLDDVNAILSEVEAVLLT